MESSLGYYCFLPMVRSSPEQWAGLETHTWSCGEDGSIVYAGADRRDAVARRVLPWLWDKASNRPAEGCSSPLTSVAPGAWGCGARGGANTEDPRFARASACGE